MARMRSFMLLVLCSLFLVELELLLWLFANEEDSCLEVDAAATEGDDDAGAGAHDVLGYGHGEERFAAVGVGAGAGEVGDDDGGGAGGGDAGVFAGDFDGEGVNGIDLDGFVVAAEDDAVALQGGEVVDGVDGGVGGVCVAEEIFVAGGFDGLVEGDVLDVVVGGEEGDVGGGVHLKVVGSLLLVLGS